MIIKPVHAALEYYRRLNDAAKERKSLDLEERRLSIAEAASGSTAGTSTWTNSDSSNSPRLSRSSRQSCLTVLRSEDSTSDDLAAIAAIDSAVAEQEEEEEEDTITEVEVSEKTLKFKISTETAPSSNNFRKRSFDKQTSFEEKLIPPSQHHVITPATSVPHTNETAPARNSFFSRLKGFKERLYGNCEKSPEKISLKNMKKDVCSLERRRSSTSSIAELKQSVSDDMGNGKSKNKNTLSGSLDCVLSGKDKHSSKKGIFYRLRGGDRSSSVPSRSPGSKVAAFVGSFRKRPRDDK